MVAVYNYITLAFMATSGGHFSRPSGMEAFGASLCSEGHFSNIVFGRTLFEYCVRKDTYHDVRKDTYMTLCSEGHIDIMYCLYL